MDFTKKLTLEPSKVTDQDRTAVLDAGHSQTALKDVIAIVSLFSCFNRLVDGHGIEGSPKIFDRDADMFHAGGYLPPPK
ncbi:hypothetical protein K1718_00085 [Roseibium porphyridii]|uniref:Peroxidase n=1 Tax=Roseibium porphyridii TaxID=2866279 RepID=A0ABY8F978_9HYPH|nr:hypothetical protein [Roseibium sp. KMA01]WFE89795.1 hypothetical protein K1718_00085 [Roseibium sp. KMA01]